MSATTLSAASTTKEVRACAIGLRPSELKPATQEGGCSEHIRIL
jgi:hypothetical protein